jgi:hypothetical protein
MKKWIKANVHGHKFSWWDEKCIGRAFSRPIVGEETINGRIHWRVNGCAMHGMGGVRWDPWIVSWVSCEDHERIHRNLHGRWHMCTRRIGEFSGSMRGFTGGATGGATGGPMLLMKMRNNKEMQIIEMEIMIHECLCILYDFVCLYGIWFCLCLCWTMLCYICESEV